VLKYISTLNTPQLRNRDDVAVLIQPMESLYNDWSYAIGSRLLNINIPQ